VNLSAFKYIRFKGVFPDGRYFTYINEPFEWRVILTRRQDELFTQYLIEFKNMYANKLLIPMNMHIC